MTHRITHLKSQHLFGVTSTRLLESTAALRLPAHTLMTRAGIAISRLAQALAPHAGRFWIFCGPGNNGGDGFEAAFQLKNAGAEVSVVFGGDALLLPPDARDAFERAQQAGVIFSTRASPDASPQDLYIDSLLGIGGGSSRKRHGTPDWTLHHLQQLQDAPCPVLAVDLPSGLNADTGQYAEGLSPAGQARSPRHTLSLLTLKPGLFTGHGRDATGTVWLDELGVSNDHQLPDAILGGAPAASIRSHASHKGSFGDVSILGGEGIGRRGMGMTGAALLAGSAALHAGAGRVLVALLDGNGGITTDTAQPELMLRTCQALDLTQGTIVCGCGGGEAIHEFLPRVLRDADRLVLDADALNAIAADPALQDLLLNRAGQQQITVLTPHPLEAARLLGTDAVAIQADRLAAAVRLSHRFACIAVVKGSGTVIAAPGRIPVINPTGNGRLATAGTGDVLAGMVGARLAIPSSGNTAMPEIDHFAEVCDAVYHHGALADAWPAQRPLTAGALARQCAAGG